MAKKNNISSSGDNSIMGLLNSIDDDIEVLAESKVAQIKDYIDTGSYILNACMTGSLFGGAPTGRVLTLAGAPSCLHENEMVDVYVFRSKTSNGVKHNIKDLRTNV